MSQKIHQAKQDLFVTQPIINLLDGRSLRPFGLGNVDKPCIRHTQGHPFEQDE